MHGLFMRELDYSMVHARAAADAIRCAAFFCLAGFYTFHIRRGAPFFKRLGRNKMLVYQAERRAAAERLIGRIQEVKILVAYFYMFVLFCSSGFYICHHLQT